MERHDEYLCNAAMSDLHVVNEHVRTPTSINLPLDLVLCQVL